MFEPLRVCRLVQLAAQPSLVEISLQLVLLCKPAALRDRAMQCTASSAPKQAACCLNATQ